MHPLMEALMFSEENGAIGWSNTYKKGVTDALFLDSSKLPQSKSRTKTNADVIPRGVYLLSVVCCED